MEQKNRLLLTLLVIALIVGAMFTSFGRGLFVLNTPRVTLPKTGSDQSGGGGSSSSHQTFETLEVTPQTVQSVIATLSRTDSCYRELTVERFWTGGSSTAQIRVWTDGGWSKVRRVVGNGSVRWDMVGPEEGWFWYEGGRSYVSVPTDELAADLAQQIPTYETILALPPESITDAGYEERGGVACIYVQSEQPEEDYVRRWWVNIQSGLLISAETEKAGELVYRMMAYSAIQSPCPSTTEFALPDGTVKHTLE